MRVKHHIFWGLVLLALAGGVLFHNALPQLGLPLWKLIIVMLFAIDGIDDLWQKKLIGSYIDFSLVFIVLNSEYQWLDAGFWTMCFAWLLSYLGIRLLFKPFRKQVFYNSEGKRQRLVGKSLGSSVRYIKDEYFDNGSADVAFGDATIYFNNAKIVGERATFTVDAAFSAITLYVPQTWAVDVKGDSVFSTVDYQPQNVVTDKTLVVKADMAFSSLKINFI